MGTSGEEPRVTVDQGIGTAVSASGSQAAAANAAAVATLPAVAGKTNYLTGLVLAVGSAAAAVNLVCTVTGVVGGPWSMVLVGGTVTGDQIFMPFVQPVPASGAGVAITATIPASGVSGPPIAAVVTGYYE